MGLPEDCQLIIECLNQFAGKTPGIYCHIPCQKPRGACLPQFVAMSASGQRNSLRFFKDRAFAKAFIIK